MAEILLLSTIEFITKTSPLQFSVSVCTCMLAWCMGKNHSRASLYAAQDWTSYRYVLRYAKQQDFYHYLLLRYILILIDWTFCCCLSLCPVDVEH